MDLYPAIDLRDGRCVRLYQGSYDRETVYGDDPAAQARQFAAAGAPWIHVVDLDAARSGDPVNRGVIAAIVDAVDIPVQCGGGVRSVEAAGALTGLGVARVVVGTAALENPTLVFELAERCSVAVGIDARGRDVATHGWEQATGRDLLDVVAGFADSGAAAFVVTEIGRDGTLEGPDMSGLAAVLAETDIPVIASGGVGALGDLAALAALERDGHRLVGTIVGRALYDGRFSVEEALAVSSGSDA